MTRNSLHPDDQPLVDFLRRHRPSPPPPARDLEADLLAAIAAEPAPPTPAVPQPWSPWDQTTPSLRQWFTLVPALAAGFALVWGTVRPPQNAPAIAQGTAQNAQPELATFFEASWNGSLSQSASYTWMSSDTTAIALPEGRLDRTPRGPAATPTASPQPGDQSSLGTGGVPFRS